MYNRANDKVSFLTHYIGALMSGAGIVLLMIKPFFIPEITARQLVAALIFGLALVALYTSSAAYHYQNIESDRRVTLRKLDHAMIYVLIAGTYTPVCLGVFEQPKGIYFCLGLWAAAFAGMAFKVLWIDCPRIISVILYLAMGWSIILDIPSIARFPFGGRLFLILGGLFYTIGAVIYGMKRPNFGKRFGFHELFHIFVMLGSLMHFLMVYLYIL